MPPSSSSRSSAGGASSGVGSTAPSGAASSTSSSASASHNHPHILMVNDELDVICFKRNGVRRDTGEAAIGPFFVVREWDAKVIRAVKKGSKKSNRPGGPTTEQALRASVRQAILNLQLHLEPANKSEIQYLKSVDILGKRAPSCSLLNVRDLLKLLYCFDKKRHAEDLKHALKDEERLTPDDPSAVLLTRINTKQAPKPIVLRAAPKTPIPADAFSVRAIEITLPKGAAANLLKRARAANGGAAISDRKRKTASVDAARGASGAAATPSRMDDAGSGLLQLLSALGKPQVDDDVSDPAAADIEGELVSGVVDADGFVLPQAKRSKMSAQVSPLTIVAAAEPPPAESPMHAALRAAAAHHAAESPLALALVSAAQVHASSPLASPTAYYSPSSSFGLKRPSSVASLPAAALLGGATPYKSSPLDRGDSPYTQALFSTRAALPSAVVVPVSPAQRATAPLPGGSGGSGSFYRHLLSPSPSPAPSPQLSEASMAVFEPITTPV